MTDVAHSRPLFGFALRGIFAALGSDVLQKVFGLGVVLIILSVLKPYEYGVWQLILSVLTAFDILLFPSIATMLIADVSRELGVGERGRASAIVRRAVPLFIALGFMGTVLMVFASPIVSRVSGIDLTLPLQIIALALIAEGISQGYQIILQGTLSLAHAQAYKVLKRFWYVAGVLVFVFFAHYQIIGVTLSYVFSIYLPLIIYAPLVFSRYRSLTRERYPNSSPFLEAVWQRGRWAVGGDVIAALTGSLTPWIIGYYLSVADIGYISIATMILGQVASLAPISFILRSILPRTLEVEGRTRAWLARSMKYAIWAQITGGLAAVVSVYFLVPIFFQAYVAVVPLVAALLVILPVRAIGAAASEWFYAQKLQKALFLVSNIPKVVMLALMPPLLAYFGMAGYVVWSILTTDVLAYLRLQMVEKQEGGRLSLGEILLPDREDRAIMGRILDAFSKLRRVP